ncbi:MAG: iron-sulfur cluster assembly scaffold protein [Pseudomonadota bacterium]
MNTDPYNAEVRRRFAEPRHAGVADIAVRRSGQGVDIELSAAVDDARIAAMRFRVYGCPHTVAACDAVCEALEGGPLAAMQGYALGSVMRSLSVPVEKTGRILVLEDALRDLSSLLETS